MPFSKLEIKAKKGLLLFVLAFVTIFFYANKAFSISSQEEKAEPAISDVSIFEKDKALYLSFYLKNGLPKYIEKAIRSGIPVKYYFSITLKKNGFLWDDKLLSFEVKKTIIFDNLKNKFFIFQNYPSNKVLTTRKLKKAKEYLLTVKNLKLISLKQLSKNNRYSVEIKARCEKEKTSIPFSRLIKFFSSFGFSTETYEFEFIY